MGCGNAYGVSLFRFLIRIYNLYLSPERNFARKVRQLTGFVPSQLSLFRLAFSHKSGNGVRDGVVGQSNNERLEYLGDAVLGTVVAEYLFKKYPDADEGFLTKMRSKIVKRKSLNLIGDRMGLNVFLQEQNRTRLSSSMLGNAVEALVGAVYLERGYDLTTEFIVRRILKLYVDIHELETTDDNYKSQLLEACQKQGKSITYKLISKYKQDRRDRFQVGVIIAGEQVSLADDYNKKAAEQLASLKALEKLGLLDAAEAPVEKMRNARIIQSTDEDSHSTKRPAGGERPGRADKAKRRDKTEGGSERGGQPQPALHPDPDEVLYQLAEETPADAVASDMDTARAKDGMRRSERGRSGGPKRTGGRQDPVAYHVRHGVRSAVAAAGVLDAFNGEVNPYPPTPAQGPEFRPKDTSELNFAADPTLAPARDSARPRPKRKKGRRRTSLEFHVGHAVKGGVAVAVAMDGLFAEQSRLPEAPLDGFAETRKPSGLKAMAAAVPKPATPERSPGSPPLSRHALRKVIRDAAAGVRLIDADPEYAATTVVAALTVDAE